MRLWIIAGFLCCMPYLNARAQQTQTVRKGAIEGSVVSNTTGEVIPGARLSVSKASEIAGSPQAARNVISVNVDRQGQFAIKNLDPGEYRLTIVANGYVRMIYIPPVPRRGTANGITVQSGEIVGDLVIKMTPTGLVTGFVLDQSGQPAVGAEVVLSRRTYTATGERILDNTVAGTADDRGAYRLFGVTPGRYYLSAAAPQSFGPTEGNNVPRDYALTYYPGVATLDRATTIEVQAGSEFATGFLTVPDGQTYSIRGRIIDSTTGKPSTDGVVSIVQPTRTMSGTIGFRVEANPKDGTFQKSGLPPGRYVLRALNPSSSTSKLGLEVPVSISDSDLSVILNLAPSVAVSGRVTIEGQRLLSTLKLDQVRITVQNADTQLRETPILPQVTPEGTFRLDLWPRDYWIRVSRLPAGLYVKRMRYDSQDALNKPVHISGSVSSPLDIVLSSTSAHIDGRVSNLRKDRPDESVEVVLVPSQRDRVDLYRSTMTDPTGHFTFDGVAPGEYKMFAWDKFEPYEYFDPDFLLAKGSLSQPAYLSFDGITFVRKDQAGTAVPETHRITQTDLTEAEEHIRKIASAALCF